MKPVLTHAFDVTRTTITETLIKLILVPIILQLILASRAMGLGMVPQSPVTRDGETSGRSGGRNSIGGGTTLTVREVLDRLVQQFPQVQPQVVRDCVEQVGY